jgi:hypothetical protein
MSQVIQRIIPVSQPRNSNQCWAAVTAMVLGRSGPGILGKIISEAKAGGVAVASDGALPPSDVPALARTFHLNLIPISETIAGQDVASHLTTAACGLFGQQPSGKHAGACNGMTGEFSGVYSSHILGVDPRGATRIHQDFMTFQRQFAIEYILYR